MLAVCDYSLPPKFTNKNVDSLWLYIPGGQAIRYIASSDNRGFICYNIIVRVLPAVTGI